MHTEDAFDFLVEFLTRLPELKAGQRPTHNDRPYGCDSPIHIRPLGALNGLTRGVYGPSLGSVNAAAEVSE